MIEKGFCYSWRSEFHITTILINTEEPEGQSRLLSYEVRYSHEKQQATTTETRHNKHPNALTSRDSLSLIHGQADRMSLVADMLL